MKAIRHAQRIRGLQAADRREQALQFADDLQELCIDIASGIDWETIAPRWRDWMLDLSPAAFDSFARRVRGTPRRDLQQQQKGTNHASA